MHRRRPIDIRGGKTGYPVVIESRRGAPSAPPRRFQRSRRRCAGMAVGLRRATNEHAPVREERHRVVDGVWHALEMGTVARNDDMLDVCRHGRPR